MSTASSKVALHQPNRTQRMRTVALMKNLGLAALCFCSIELTGCQRFGLGLRGDSMGSSGYIEDDWESPYVSTPPNSRSQVPRPVLTDRNSRRDNTLATQTSNESAAYRTSLSDTHPRDPKVVAQGPSLQSKSSKSEPSLLSTDEQDLDIESAVASLPPQYRDLLKRHLAAAPIVNKADDTKTKEGDASSSSSSSIASDDAPPSNAIAAVEARKEGVTIRMSDSTPEPETNPSANPATTLADSTPATTPPAVTTAVALETPSTPIAPNAVDNSISVSQASASLPSRPSEANALSPPPPHVPNASEWPSPDAQPLNWRQSLAGTVDLLERQLQENSTQDENLRLHQEITLRMLYVCQRRLDDAMRPIDGLSDSEKGFLTHQMQAMYEASNPDAMPVRSRHWSLVMNSQREATHHLAAASNLEVKTLAFCTEVERYGVVTKFPKYQFQADQEVLLYCEIENVTAEKLRDGFETQLQGSYEIIDSQERKIADQLLPMEPEICQNHRRDYFIVYKIYMPQQIASGNYQLRLTVEDMKARKFGQNKIDFQIKK